MRWSSWIGGENRWRESSTFWCWLPTWAEKVTQIVALCPVWTSRTGKSKLMSLFRYWLSSKGFAWNIQYEHDDRGCMTSPTTTPGSFTLKDGKLNKRSFHSRGVKLFSSTQMKRMQTELIKYKKNPYTKSVNRVSAYLFLFLKKADIRYIWQIDR